MKSFTKRVVLLRPCRLFIIMNLSHTAASSYCNTWMITACFVVRTYYTIRACDKHIPSFFVEIMVNHILFATQEYPLVCIFSFTRVSLIRQYLVELSAVFQAFLPMSYRLLLPLACHTGEPCILHSSCLRFGKAQCR